MDERKIAFIYALLKLLKSVPNTQVRVVDFVTVYEKTIEGIVGYREDFDRAFVEINNEIIQNRDNGTNYIYVILGVGEIKNKLSKDGREVLNRLFNAINNFPNSRFVFIDMYASFKNIQIESWYQSTIDNSCGIWLGTDAGSQMAINMTNLTMEDRNLNYVDMAFAVDNGKSVPIKHVIDEEVLNEE